MWLAASKARRHEPERSPKFKAASKPAPLSRDDRASLIKQVLIVFFGFLSVGLPLPPSRSTSMTSSASRPA